MVNPRQRRKAKSSTHSVISHSKRAKRLQKKMPAIRGPKTLQVAWDPSKTLRQNYLALGLQHDLNPISSGGSEIIASSTATDLPSVPEGSKATSALRKGLGRIVRDSSGNVVRVELPNNEDPESVSHCEVMIDTPMITTEAESGKWVNMDRPETLRREDSGGDEDTIIQDLERLAASATVHQRHTSFGERSYLERLVKMYDNDLDKMARDRRLNPEQRTANELRRAIVKAGIVAEPCKSTVIGVAE